MALHEMLIRLGYLKFKRIFDSLSETEREQYTQYLTKPPLSDEERIRQVIEVTTMIDEQHRHTDTPD